MGRPEDLPTATRNALFELINQTSGGGKMRLSLALSYSGRNDIVRAMQGIAKEIEDGTLPASAVDESLIRHRMSTWDLPIRIWSFARVGSIGFQTSLPFESVYSELHFPQILWPDFKEQHLLEAFGIYAGRERRFGQTSQQVADKADK